LASDFEISFLLSRHRKSETWRLVRALPVSTCPKAITLAFGAKCTVTFTFTPVANDPKENLDSGITSIRFRADPTLGPMVFNDTEITVNDVGFSATPEPTTLVLFGTGTLCLTALARLRRSNRETT
jgi:hypothetical protein